jgi:uncharacterized protein (DUF952 family)
LPESKIQHPASMIYHVTTEAEWKVSDDKTHYAPAAFSREGFIHSCHASQLPGVLQRYFSGRTDLLLLHIEETALTSPLKHEIATADELYPHIYGEINKDAIVKIERLAN